MSLNRPSVNGAWVARWTFILAAAGSAIGLGNIWKFPFITGEYGGGAFVLVYLACIAVIGVPLMMAEVAIGRHGRRSPIIAMRDLARESGASRRWGLVGVSSVLAGFLILSFYSVIAGWALEYTWQIGAGHFAGTDGAEVGRFFDGLLADPGRLTLWHSLFMLITGLVIARGIHKGLESCIRVMMPALLVLLLALVGYAWTMTDQFGAGLAFLFSFDFSKLTADAVLAAMGHAFFTLSLGMGAIMAYGAYMPNQSSIGGTVMTVALLDTLIALLAGMAIFPIVFANGMEPSAGPGLLFVSLPAAFGAMPFGAVLGAAFFLLVSIAALSSSISLMEPAVAWLVERFQMSRVVATLLFSLVVWALGMISVFSFNHWSGAEYQLLGMSPFELLDFMTSKVMLPLNGILIAIFAGWIMRRSIIMNELSMASLVRFNLWRALCRIIAPVAVFVVFAVSLYEFIAQRLAA